MKTVISVICVKYTKFEEPKISYILKETLVILLFAVSVRMEMKNILTRIINWDKKSCFH